jgi:regulator of protease activity HflC (stomatin/prohibitin superfamily)
MDVITITALVIAALALVALALSIRVVKQYERGVVFRFGRVIGTASPACASSSRSST